MPSDDGIQFSIDPASIANLEKQLLRKLQRAYYEGGTSLKQQGEEIMGESRRQAPEHTGTLVNAGFVDVQGSGDTETIRIGYDGTHINPKSGDSVASYIIPVHERLDVFHPKGNAKFFEVPVLQYAPQFARSIAAAIREALSG